MSKPHAIVIGAGFTGVATAYDLAQRGFAVTVVERGDIINGTSGRTHGILHSGGRYAVKDKESATECIDENLILRKICPQAIEPNGGLFVAIDESDMAYKQTFIESCAECHIATTDLTPAQTFAYCPHLNPKLLGAVLVPDGTFDPLRLALSFAASAKSLGAKFTLYTEVTDMLFDQAKVVGIKAVNRTNGHPFEIRADIVINATGAWAGSIAAMANSKVEISPSPGVMVAYDQRLTDLPINRLNKPADGDIIVPQRRMMVVGTTSFFVESPDYVPVVDEHVQLMLTRGSELIPAIAKTNPRGVYMATRPLVGGGTTGRSIARTFKCFDHDECDGVNGFLTITGGKATTLRAMAEKATDMACQKIGLDVKCRTMDIPLVPYRQFFTLPN